MSNQKKTLALAPLMELVALLSGIAVPILLFAAFGSDSSSPTGSMLVAASVLFVGCRIWLALNAIHDNLTDQPSRSLELPARRA